MKESIVIIKDDWIKLAQDRIALLEACKEAHNMLFYADRDLSEYEEKLLLQIGQAIAKAEDK